MKSLIALTLLLGLIANIPADAKNLLKPANKEDSWRLEQTDGGKGEMKIDGDAVVFKVKEVDGTNWHVQAIQPDLDLKEGGTYVLKFEARSPDRNDIMVNAMIDQADWTEIGLHEEISLGKEYHEYSYEFTATGTVAKKNRIGFVLGTSKGEVLIKNVSLTAK